MRTIGNGLVKATTAICLAAGIYIPAHADTVTWTGAVNNQWRNGDAGN